MIKTFIRLWHALEKAKPFYIAGLFFMVIDSACQVMVPMFFRDVLNNIQDDAAAYLDGPIYVTLAWAGLLIAIFFPAALFGHAFARIAVARLTRNLQVNLFEHVQSLSTDFFEEKPVGEITSRMSGDLDQISASLGIAIGVIWGLVTMVYAFVMMVYVNVYLAGLFLIMLAIVALLMFAGLPIMKRKSRAVRDAAGRATASVTEYISINELIRSYAGEDHAAGQVDVQSQQVRKAAEKLAWFFCLYNDATQTLVKFIAPFGLLLIGAIMVNDGQVRIGDLVAFWGFWLMTSHSLGILFNGFALIIAGFASADRVFEFFDHTPLVKDKAEAKAAEHLNGEVHFDQVEFAYPSAPEAKVLHGIDIKIEQGQMVAFVGHSGSGKSTLIKMLMRFYDPIAGAVRVDGEDIRDLQQRSLRDQMALVMQNSYFFSGTVEQNLLLAKPDASFDEIKQALKDANAWDFINDSPEGLQTNLGENGMKLSGGQRQRLSIARAFLKNPKILLMDEPTSALDAASEKQVQEAVKRIVKGRTTIMIAHRIVTIQEADVIFVMDQGVLLDQGTHGELLERCDLYRDACELQQIDQGDQ